MKRSPKEIYEGEHVEGFRDELELARASSRDAFFGFFNNSESVEDAFEEGVWDFTKHIAEPLTPFFPVPGSLEALEIGYGGGRLLSAATRYFGHVQGVDIHPHKDLVTAELNARGYQGFDLHQSDGEEIPLPDHSVDLVYSFIVLQHVQYLEVFQRYLEESARVLRRGGMALLYFGRFNRFSVNSTSLIRYMMDLAAEPMIYRGSYREMDAAVNSTNLQVHPIKVIQMAENAGLKLQGLLVSKRRASGSALRFGRQHGILLQKP
jgi:ubiquinone/menaquinone biosynthesis C-methylase UbiE